MSIFNPDIQSQPKEETPPVVFQRITEVSLGVGIINAALTQALASENTNRAVVRSIEKAWPNRPGYSAQPEILGQLGIKPVEAPLPQQTEVQLKPQSQRPEAPTLQIAEMQNPTVQSSILESDRHDDQISRAGYVDNLTANIAQIRRNADEAAPESKTLEDYLDAAA